MNQRFINDVPNFQQGTSSEGEYTEIKLKYIDIRFSNLCNLKCRGCGPSLSSSWYDDYQKLYDFKSEDPKVRSISNDSPDFWKIFKNVVLDAEEIYFGGGEPLITKEHFDLLRYLISIGKTDVRLSYNTNLTTLTYGNHNLAELWSQFKDVNLGISIDDLGLRGEYFRSGTKWAVLENNLRILKDSYPLIRRYVNCTVNLTNIYYLPELYEYLTAEKVINENGFNINLLLDPNHLRIDVLPREAKMEVKRKLEAFMAKFGEHPPKFFYDLKNIIQHMLKEDHSHELPSFIKITKKLDQIRSEDFIAVYPELAKIINFV